MEHIKLENQAAEIRIANDNINGKIDTTKKNIQRDETEMFEIMRQLQPFAESHTPEIESLREKLATVVRQLEAADFKLADLRQEQLVNVESIRVHKVNIWGICLDDRVDNIIQEVEIAMDLGKDGWPTGRKRKAMSSLEEELHEIKTELDEEEEKGRARGDELRSLAVPLEKRFVDLGQHHEDHWLIESEEQDVLSKLLAYTWELQVLARKRAHIRDKQLLVLQNISKIRRVQCMLNRQAEIQALLTSKNRSVMMDQAARIEQFSWRIQEAVRPRKDNVARVAATAMETQTRLRELKHVQNSESDATRDALLLQVYEILLDDISLAWLRKEQLQTINMSGLLLKELYSKVEAGNDTVQPAG